MMRTKRQQLAGVLAAAAVLVLAACGGSGESLAGTSWVYEYPDGASRVTFHDDGTALLEEKGPDDDSYRIVDEEATWDLADSEGTLSSSAGGATMTFAVDGDELTVTLDGESVVFNKE